jgi:hypothetical protein
MFKKLLLCFSFIAAQSQITQSLEFGDSLSEGFAPRKTSLQVLQNAPQYLVDTFKLKSDLGIGDRSVCHNTFRSKLAVSVKLSCYLIATYFLGKMLLTDVLNNNPLAIIKSDLSIGNNIAPHHTFVEQLAAGVRFTCYGLTSMTLAQKLLGDMSTGDKDVLDELKNISPIEVCLTIPLIEEAIFTYGPQLLDRLLLLKSKGSIPVLASIIFGLIHTQNSFAFNTIRILNHYAKHRYMSTRSIWNVASVCQHIMNNSCVYLVIVFIQSTQAV